MNVGCFYLQSIGFFGLKVQWLFRMTKINVFLLMAKEKEQINIMLMDESHVYLITFSEF